MRNAHIFPRLEQKRIRTAHPPCNGIVEQAVGWKQIAAADKVHLVESGYEKMAESLT
jgi:hypothetical protein